MFLFGALAVAHPGAAFAQETRGAQQNAVVPGELVVEPATLINLGFEWWIEGDDNRNASVAVAFRERGESAWRPALPLLRLHGERIYSESRVDVVAPNMFAGSILDLTPGTEYEAQFTIADPDGVRGDTERTDRRPHARRADATARRTRVSRLSARLHRTETEPAFEGLMCAYNEWCAGTDWATSGRPRVRPGDTIVVHAGVYQVQPLRVHERCGRQPDDAARRHVLPDGRRHAGASRSRSVAAGDGDVIFDGNGNYALFDVRAADYTYFEGITFRNAEVAILAGTQFIAGSKG